MANESVVIHICYSLRISIWGAAVSKVKRHKRAGLGLSAACLARPTENLVQRHSWRRAPALCRSSPADVPIVMVSLPSHPAGDQVHAGPRLEAVHCAFGVTVRWRCGEADKGNGGPFGLCHGGRFPGSVVTCLKPYGLFIKETPNKLNQDHP